MDATTSRLVSFASKAKYSEIRPDAVHECKRRIIDTFACAMGAYNEPLSQMARAVARRYEVSGDHRTARVWGCHWRTTPDAAAFANGVMLRLLDISDMYRVMSGGHPSDVIAGILAVGEAVHADGASAINAVTLAYDIYCSFCDSIDINSKGWDQPVYSGIACAVAAGKLLNLTDRQMGNAVALALAPNMALFQTRTGDLSGWKGCAAANASRNGVFAALLAQDGFTGPTAVFEGKGGLWDIVGRFDWQLPASPGGSHGVARTHMKCFPVCYHGQSAVSAILKLRSRVRLEDIRDIQIETYRTAVEVMGSHPSRWAPTTRETADHSLPYVTAVVLLDGEVSSRSFSEARLASPAVMDLMKKVKVNESEELSAQYPDSAPCRVTMRTSSGATIEAEVKYAKGHINDPMSDAELNEKFRNLFPELARKERCRAALQALWSLDRAGDVGEIPALFSDRTGSNQVC
ncbi:MAG: MmgE/PrpD family protein [Betaproteobacteria bacterium]|nr:MmgE/PrpD family protein [Betaproteobacteria bacterium]